MYFLEILTGDPLQCFMDCPNFVVADNSYRTTWSLFLTNLAKDFFCLFLDLILYVPSTIYQLYRDGSSWVEPVLS